MCSLDKRFTCSLELNHNTVKDTMTPGETHVKQGGNGSERKTMQQGVNVLLSCLRFTARILM